MTRLGYFGNLYPTNLLTKAAEISVEFLGNLNTLAISVNKSCYNFWLGNLSSTLGESYHIIWSPWLRQRVEWCIRGNCQVEKFKSKSLTTKKIPKLVSKLKFQLWTWLRRVRWRHKQMSKICCCCCCNCCWWCCYRLAQNTFVLYHMSFWNFNKLLRLATGGNFK